MRWKLDENIKLDFRSDVYVERVCIDIPQKDFSRATSLSWY
jgi:hypothetical protein